jgi:predicted nucleic acid-binding protein
MPQAAEAMVVDASVAVKWHLQDEAFVPQADLLLTRFTQGKTNLLAPDYIRYEVPAAITVASRGTTPRIRQAQAQEAIEEFLALELTTVGSNELILAAYHVVHQYEVAFYDGLYLAVAQRLGLPFITADRKLYDRIRQLPPVIWIGDYAPQNN